MQKISSFTPSSPLPRKRRREQTEFAAPADAISHVHRLARLPRFPANAPTRAASGHGAGAKVYNRRHPPHWRLDCPMDLGISGRKAIVCASSRGLGRGRAFALARAGCQVIVNGRDGETLEATAAELRHATGAKVTAVMADVATPEGQAALLAACPQPDILVNNNAGPPFWVFLELILQQLYTIVVTN